MSKKIIGMVGCVTFLVGFAIFQFAMFMGMRGGPVYNGTRSLKAELKTTTVSLFSVGDGGSGTCSGTIINEIDGDHHILTAKHCIHRSDEAFVDRNNTKLILASTHEDLAYIIVDGKIPGKKVAPLAQFNSYIDEQVHHAGYPEEHFYISTGKVHRNASNDSYVFMESRGGCSGGGIFNNEGELVGVLWGGYDTFKDKMTLYESVNKIRTFLAEIQINTGINYTEKDNGFINIPDPIEETPDDNNVVRISGNTADSDSDS